MTIFVQEVWGYSPVRSGIAYLPMVCLDRGRGGARLAAGRADRRAAADHRRAAAGGRRHALAVPDHGAQLVCLRPAGPTRLTGLGMGLTFVPLSLVALAKVPNKDTGVASSLLNTGQQVGGSIGLAILGTVAWSAVASNTKSAVAATHGAHLSATAQTALGQPRARLRVRPRVPGVGGDLAPGGDHRGGDDPDQAVGPGGHRPDGGGAGRPASASCRWLPPVTSSVTER